jgi:hypothetical protein
VISAKSSTRRTTGFWNSTAKRPYFDAVWAPLSCFGHIDRRQFRVFIQRGGWTNFSGESGSSSRVGVHDRRTRSQEQSGRWSCKRITQLPPQHARTQQVAMFAARLHLAEKVLTVSCRPDLQAVTLKGVAAFYFGPPSMLSGQCHKWASIAFHVERHPDKRMRRCHPRPALK